MLILHTSVLTGLSHCHRISGTCFTQAIASINIPNGFWQNQPYFGMMIVPVMTPSTAVIAITNRNRYGLARTKRHKEGQHDPDNRIRNAH